jgi:hypothetical protein
VGAGPAREDPPWVCRGCAVGVSSPQPGAAFFSAACAAGAQGCQKRAQTEWPTTWEAARCSVPIARLGVATREPSACIISGNASSMVCIVDEGDWRLAAWGLGYRDISCALRTCTHGLFASLAASSLLPRAVASCITTHSVRHPPGDPASSRQYDVCLVPDNNVPHQSCSCCPRREGRAPARGTLQPGCLSYRAHSSVTPLALAASPSGVSMCPGPRIVTVIRGFTARASEDGLGCVSVAVLPRNVF